MRCRSSHPTLRALGLGALGLALLWVVGANLTLHLVVPGLLNERPDRLQVTWGKAWTVIPGLVHVRDLRIDGTGRHDQWTLDLPAARAWIHLPSLPGRVFRASGLRATGGSFVYALRQDGGDPDRPRAAKGPWTIQLRDVWVHQMDALQISGQRFTGDADLAGELTLADKVDAAVQFAIRDGAVSGGGRPLVSALRGSASATLDGLQRFGPIGRDALDRIQAHAVLQARADDLSRTAVYLQRVPWLTIQGAADAEVDLTVLGGTFAPGSRVQARTDALTVGFRAYQILGDATLELEVESTPAGPRSFGSARYGAFTIGEAGAVPMVAGEGFALRAEAGAITLAQPLEDLRATLKLPPSTVQNLPAYTGLLPDGSGIEVHGGRGVLHGQLTADAEAGTAQGSMRVELNALDVGMDALRMGADVAVDIELPAGDLTAGTYDLSGSEVQINGFGFLDEPERDWWARMRLARGVARTGARTYADLSVQLACASSGPIVQIAAQRAKIPGWVQNLLDVPDLRGQAQILLRTDAIVVRDLALTGGAAEVRLNLLRRGKRNDGALFARLGPLSLGVGVAGDYRSIHPLGARSWFAAQELDLDAPPPLHSAAP